MTQFLFIAAAVCVLAILGNKISDRLGVPVLLIFIGIGLLFGVNGIFRIDFENYRLTEQLSTVALMYIMFFGGFGTNWKTAKPVFLPAAVLSSAGVLLTAVLCGLFAHFVLGFPLLEGLLLGAVVGSTDAASVFSLFRQRKLNLSGGLAPLLEIESGSNDPFAYMMTVLLLGLMQSGGSLSVPSVFSQVFEQLFFGLLFGALIGGLASYVLKHISLQSGSMYYIFTLSVVLFAYILPGLFSGNGFLSVYVTGILMGNQKIRHKTELVHFFDGLTGILQIMLFFFLGLLATPARFAGLLLPAVSVTLFLTFAARPAAVWILLSPFGFSNRQKLFISLAGLRGAASIVFAIYTVLNGAGLQNDIFHIIFCIAIFSVGLQGAVLPWAAKKLSLIDDSEDVRRTFTDYQNETSMNLIEIMPENGHPWLGQTLSDIALPKGMLAVMIRRGSGTIVPHGDTVIKKGDRIIVSCLNYTEPSEVELTEISVGKSSRLRGRTLSEISFPKNQLVVMVKREEEYFTPNGNTELRTGDVLIVCEEVG